MKDVITLKQHGDYSAAVDKWLTTSEAKTLCEVPVATQDGIKQRVELAFIAGYRAALAERERNLPERLRSE